MLDIPINVVSTAPFHQFVIKLMERGIEISHLTPDIKLAEAMMVSSDVMLADGQLPVFALFPPHCPFSAQFICHHCNSFSIDSTGASLG
jgi:hypothetical protein